VINGLYDSSTISFIAISLVAREVSKMPVHVGLLFTGLILRTILGVVVIAALLVLSWKIGRLADAYTEKLKAK
jgi:hypothetical protein